MMRTINVTKRVTFEACHYLPNYEGKCANMHGHSYKVEVTFKGQVFSPEDVSAKTTPSALTMVHDFTDLKKLLNETVVNRFDHKNLNDFLDFPTAEHLAIDIYDRLVEEIGREDYSVAKVRVWETEDSYATYYAPFYSK